MIDLLLLLYTVVNDKVDIENKKTGRLIRTNTTHSDTNYIWIFRLSEILVLLPHHQRVEFITTREIDTGNLMLQRTDVTPQFHKRTVLSMRHNPLIVFIGQNQNQLFNFPNSVSCFFLLWILLFWDSMRAYCF